MAKIDGYPLLDRRNAAPVVLVLLLAVVTVAGGSSRADFIGQPVVRLAAALAIAAVLLLPPAPARRDLRVVVGLMLGATVLVAMQLVPVPPSLWAALPGREPFMALATLAGQGAVWRPIALNPDGAINALFALLVPWSVLACYRALDGDRAALLLPMALLMILASAFVELQQITSTGFLTDGGANEIESISGLFANRNHQALALAIGIVLAARWGSEQSRERNWRLWVALGLIALFVLSIGATGSRAGLALGAIALVGAGAFGWRAVAAQSTGHLNRRAFIIALLTAIVGIAGLVAISIRNGRAVTFFRLVDQQSTGDLRVRAFPTVKQIAADFFPVGTGQGGFDYAFRSHESLALLSPKYFNHAHNDLIEPIIEAGVVGLALLIFALGWVVWRSVMVWRDDRDILGHCGVFVLVLAIGASVVDYPVRTPIVMALVMIGAIWLSPAQRAWRATALPKSN